MKNLALLFSASVTTSVIVFAGCSSTTGTTTDGGVDSATTTDATTPTDAASDGGSGSVCDLFKPCPSDSPTADKGLCLKEESGACGAQWKTYVRCLAPKAFCNDAGKSDFDPNVCPAEGKAYADCAAKPADDAGPDSTTPDSGGDAAPAVVGGCTSFVDMTDPVESRRLDWTLPLTDPNRCMMIKVGQEVTWIGNFGNHPLAASGGDTPSPIVDAGPGDGSVAATFTRAGVYGFKCTIHSSMTGAIKVVP